MIKSKRKLLLASILGNALEFYDFTLYGTLTVVLAKTYFPGNNDTSQLLFSLTAFAIGFFTRPLGALLFGHLGDTFGRKKALSLSILLMGLPTFIIGIAPSYQTIGITASFIIFICRLLQGLFTGGECNGASIFSIEHFQGKRAGLIGGLITGSCVIGAITATTFSTWALLPSMPVWMWRIPFVIGGIFAVLGFFMRKTIEETPEFSTSEAHSSSSSLFSFWHTHRHSCLTAFFLGSFNGALTYTLFGFLNIYLSRYMDIPLFKAMETNIFGLLAFMIGSPLLGNIFDIYGKKRYLFYTVISIITILIPTFILFSFDYIIIGQILLGLCVASIAGSAPALMQNLFPVKERYRGISFNFNMGMGLFGGITPIIYVYMIEQQGLSLLFPAYFLMGMAVCFGLFILVPNQVASNKPISV